MEMPGYLDHGKMLMMPPSAYGAAQEQLGLAQLFQAEKQKQDEYKTLADMMANDQSRKMNPLLVKQQQMNNEKLGMANEDTGMSLGIRKATYPQEMQQKITDYALKVDESKLKTIEQKINLAYMSGDPEKIEQAKQAEQMLASVREAKRKAADAMELERYKQTQQTGRATERNNTTLESARIGAESRVTAAGTRGGGPVSVIQSFAKMKVPERMGMVRAILATGINPDTKQPLSAIEQTYFENMYNQDVAGTDAKLNAVGGKLDTAAATGLPVNPLPSTSTLPPKDVAPRASSPVQHKLADVMAMYPGKTEAEVRAAYKRKFGSDL